MNDNHSLRSLLDTAEERIVRGFWEDVRGGKEVRRHETTIWAKPKPKNIPKPLIAKFSEALQAFREAYGDAPIWEYQWRVTTEVYKALIAELQLAPIVSIGSRIWLYGIALEVDCLAEHSTLERGELRWHIF